MRSLKRARKKAGLSLTELARATGLHRMSLARAERPNTDAKASTVDAIARALGLPVCHLFDEPGHGRKN